jgi:hypothetical protein
MPKRVARCIWRELNDTREINCGSLREAAMKIKIHENHKLVTSQRTNDQEVRELIKLITLLIKYSGPPKMYAVGTVSFHIRLCFPSEKRKCRRRKDESN